MVSREVLGPPDLSGAQALRIFESTEVVTVNENEDLVFAAFHVLAPSFEGFNDSQELLIMSLVPSLCKNYLSGEKDH